MDAFLQMEMNVKANRLLFLFWSTAQLSKGGVYFLPIF